MDTTTLCGTARIEITPEKPVFMGGFGQRIECSKGVHDRLYAKALFLSDGIETLLFITTDLIHIPLTLARAVLERIRERNGIPVASICITASHTHSGPTLAEHPGEPEWDYAQFLISALVNVGCEAINDAHPAAIRVGRGKAGYLFNRRTRGSRHPADDRVFVLAASDEKTEEIKAVLFGWGCHPVTLGWENYLLSADFPGFAQRLIERELSARNGLFFNMAAGNILPDVRPDTDALDPRGYRHGSFQDAAHIGKLLGEEVIHVVRNTPPAQHLRINCRMENCRIRVAQADLDPMTAHELLLRHQATIESYLGPMDWGRAAGTSREVATLWADASNKVIEAELSEQEMRRLMAATCLYRAMLTRVHNPERSHHDVPVHAFAINEYRFVALPGEVVAEIALDWQERNGSTPAFVVSLANGHFQYLPHASNFHEQGWETRYETMANSLAPEAAAVLLDAAEKLVHIESQEEKTR